MLLYLAYKVLIKWHKFEKGWTKSVGNCAFFVQSPDSSIFFNKLKKIVNCLIAIKVNMNAFVLNIKSGHSSVIWKICNFKLIILFSKLQTALQIERTQHYEVRLNE